MAGDSYEGRADPGGAPLPIPTLFPTIRVSFVPSLESGASDVFLSGLSIRVIVRLPMLPSVMVLSAPRERGEGPSAFLGFMGTRSAPAGPSSTNAPISAAPDSPPGLRCVEDNVVESARYRREGTAARSSDARNIPRCAGTSRGQW